MYLLWKLGFADDLIPLGNVVFFTFLGFIPKDDINFKTCQRSKAEQIFPPLHVHVRFGQTDYLERLVINL